MKLSIKSHLHDLKIDFRGAAKTSFFFEKSARSAVGKTLKRLPQTEGMHEYSSGRPKIPPNLPRTDFHVREVVLDVSLTVGKRKRNFWKLASLMISHALSYVNKITYLTNCKFYK